MVNGRCFPQRFDDAEKSECFKCCTAGGLREPCAWTTDSLTPAQSAWRGSRCLLQRPWGLCGAIWVEISSDICIHALRANLPLLPGGHCGGGAPATFFFRRLPSSAPTRFEGTPRHGDRRATCKSVRVCVRIVCVHVLLGRGVCPGPAPGTGSPSRRPGPQGPFPGQEECSSQTRGPGTPSGRKRGVGEAGGLPLGPGPGMLRAQR